MGGGGGARWAISAHGLLRKSYLILSVNCKDMPNNGLGFCKVFFTMCTNWRHVIIFHRYILFFAISPIDCKVSQLKYVLWCTTNDKHILWQKCCWKIFYYRQSCQKYFQNLGVTPWQVYEEAFLKQRYISDDSHSRFNDYLWMINIYISSKRQNRNDENKIVSFRSRSDIFVYPLSFSTSSQCSEALYHRRIRAWL